MPVLNYCFAANVTSDLENMNLVQRQIQLSHVYRNKLVELELARRKAYADTLATISDEFRAASDALAAVIAQIDDLYTELKKARAAVRKRIDFTDAQLARKAELFAQKRACCIRLAEAKAEAAATLKSRQEEVREDVIRNLVTPANITAAAAKKLQTAAIHQKYCELGLSAGEVEFASSLKQARSESRLYWPNYSHIESRLDSMREGTPPQFRRFEGDGSLAIQLQGGAAIKEVLHSQHTLLRINTPAMTERMATKGKDRGRQAIGQVSIRIGSDENGRKPIWFTFPVVFHRRFPEDAVIKWAFLDQRKIGSRYEYTFRVILSTETPRRNPAESGRVVVHIGHRTVDGGIRVATAVDEARSVRELVIPDSLIQRFTYKDELQQVRDLTANAAVTAMIRFLDICEERGIVLPEWFMRSVDTIASWRNSASRLSRVVGLVLSTDSTAENDARSSFSAVAARDLGEFYGLMDGKRREYQGNSNFRPKIPIDLGEFSSALDVFRLWLLFDTHMQDWSIDQERKASRHRKQIFQNWVVELHRQYREVILPDCNWAAMRQAKPAGEDADDLGAGVRRRASVASPGSLGEAFCLVFGDRAIKVDCKQVEGATGGITETCNCCKAVVDFDRKNLFATCTNCGAMWDQDHNAAMNMWHSPEVTKVRRVRKTVRNNKKKLGDGTPSSPNESVVAVAAND